MSLCEELKTAEAAAASETQENCFVETTKFLKTPFKNPQRGH